MIAIMVCISSTIYRKLPKMFSVVFDSNAAV